jgi:hypothetical protein
VCGDAQAEKFSQVIKTKRVADENMILIKKIRLKRKCEIETIHYSKKVFEWSKCADFTNHEEF